MSSEERAPDARRFVRTTRLEAFSDGVFAIAITLLVLDLAIPADGSPWERVAKGWPFYLAYVVSFLTIGAAWLGHTAITDRLDKADLVLLRINLLLLLVVAVLPFPTRLVAESLDDLEGERVFVALYGLVLLGIRLLLSALDAYARRERLYADGIDESTTGRRSVMAVVVSYGAAVVIGFLLLQSRSACTAPSPLFSSYLPPKRNASSHVARSRRTALALTAPPWSWRYRTADGGGIGRVSPDGERRPRRAAITD